MLFKPGANERLYYTVTEVADMLQVKASTLRYWEKEFDFIKPKRNLKGKRFYTLVDIEKVRTIHQLVKEKGFTLQGAREHLSSKETETVNNHAEVVAKLRKIRQLLIGIRDSL